MTDQTELSTAGPEQVRDRQDVLIREQLARVRQRHPFYRDRLAGLDRPPTGLDDLYLLAPTSKTELADAPQAFRLEPLDPPDPQDVLWDIAYTSGSTAAPTPLFQTARDFRGILLAQSRMAQIRDMTGADRIANLYPLTQHPHGAWTRANHAAAVLGAELIVGMSGAPAEPYDVTRRLDEVVALLAARQPTVLWGVPSYLKRVLEAVDAQGEQLPLVRMLAVSGEPCGAGMAAALTSLCERVGAAPVVVSNSLGASELQCGLVECEPGSGFHNPAPEQFLLETLDETGYPVGPGRPGKLALTHLDRRGTVLLRYLLGDVVTLADDRCQRCGRAGGRVLSHHRRDGSRVKVRGNLLDLGVLHQVVEDHPGVREHQVVIRPEQAGDPLSMDQLVVRVAASRDGTDTEALRSRIRAAIRVSPVIEPVDVSVIHDHDESLKARRFIDLRPQEST